MIAREHPAGAARPAGSAGRAGIATAAVKPRRPAASDPPGYAECILHRGSHVHFTRSTNHRNHFFSAGFGRFGVACQSGGSLFSPRDGAYLLASA